MKIGFLEWLPKTRSFQSKDLDDQINDLCLFAMLDMACVAAFVVGTFCVLVSWLSSL